MGVEMVVIFISAILLICGLVLILTAGDLGGRKVGFLMLMIGIFGTLIAVIAYPRDRNFYVPATQYSNESSTDYNNNDRNK
jgi:hypothetical protein